MKLRYKQQIVLLILTVLPYSFIVHGEDSDWDYRSESGSVSDSHAGRAGLFRSYDFVTTDSIELVVLWYAQRFGFPDDHSLVTAAETGFDELSGALKVTSGYGHDTEKRNDHTVMECLQWWREPCSRNYFTPGDEN